MNLIRLGEDLCSRLHVGGDTANMAVATSFKPYGIPSKNTISYTMNLIRLGGDLCSRLHVGGDTANILLCQGFVGQVAVATSFKPYGIPSKNTISYTIKLRIFELNIQS